VVRNISSVVAPSLSQRPDLFQGASYTDSNLEDMGFKERFENRYPTTQFATHMMPYTYDSVNNSARAFEQRQNPAVYLRDLRTYDGTAGIVTKEPGSGNFKSAPAVWVIRDGKPSLFSAPQSTARHRYESGHDQNHSREGIGSADDRLLIAAASIITSSSSSSSGARRTAPQPAPKRRGAFRIEVASHASGAWLDKHQGAID
jgi:hypothetical protein